MKIVSKVILFCLLSVSSNVYSQDKNETQSNQTPAQTEQAPPPKIVFKKTEQHRFQGSRLKGQLKKPELSYIYQRKGLRAEKIVNVPEKFDEEILRGTGQF